MALNVSDDQIERCERVMLDLNLAMDEEFCTENLEMDYIFGSMFEEFLRIKVKCKELQVSKDKWGRYWYSRVY